MLSESEAVPYLRSAHDLTRKDARQLLKDRHGDLWDLEQGQGKGHPQILVPVNSTAAKKTSDERPATTSQGSEPISAERMDTGRRKSIRMEAASNAREMALLFPPPSQVIQEQYEDEVLEDAT